MKYLMSDKMVGVLIKLNLVCNNLSLKKIAEHLQKGDSPRTIVLIDGALS